MAIYEFKCKDCGEVFSELRKMGDFNPGNCSKCGSKNTEKKMSTFAKAGLSMSGGSGCSHSGGGG